MLERHTLVTYTIYIVQYKHNVRDPNGGSHCSDPVFLLLIIIICTTVQLVIISSYVPSCVYQIVYTYNSLCEEQTFYILCYDKYIL